MAASRRSDPATSVDAAKLIEGSGKAAEDRRRILHCLDQGHELTYAEIAARMRMERHAVARRLPELQRAGYVDVAKTRCCIIQGTKMRTWKRIQRPKDGQLKLDFKKQEAGHGDDQTEVPPVRSAGEGALFGDGDVGPRDL